MEMLSPQIYEFGKFRLDGFERLLFDGTRVIALTPKVFDTLLMLVENSGHALAKEEMLEKIWEGSFVEENNLAQSVSILRKALGETAQLKFIETIPKRGYRFIAPVTKAGAPEDARIIIHEKVRARILIRESANDDEIFTEIQNPEKLLQSAIPNPKSAFAMPETHYAQSGEVNIAYQVIGDGDIDIVFVMGWVSHLEYFWEEPNFRAFLLRLASFSRLILFDKRGTGLSDRVPLDKLPTLEQRMDDVRAVMEAVGSEHAVLIGVSEGGPMCSLFAATYPEKTSALVMIGTYAKRIQDEDYPWGATMEEREGFFEYLRQNWGKPVGIEERAPSKAEDEDFRKWWATYLRMGASPSAAVALTKMNAEIDVRNVLPTIRVPTLVIHRSGDLCLKVEEGRYVASLIAGCKYRELGGIDHLPFVGEQAEILDEIEEFLTGVRHAGEFDRVLATVLSVQIFEPAFEIALDEIRRHEIFERSQNYVRKQIELFKGREVEFNEVNLVAAFDGPARAIRCACAINDYAERLKVPLKTGVHTGECDIIGDKYSGFAVELSKQIAATATFGEILASRTVKDLVAGSGLRFEDVGLKKFQNLPDEWRIFTVLN